MLTADNEKKNKIIITISKRKSVFVILSFETFLTHEFAIFDRKECDIHARKDFSGIFRISSGLSLQASSVEKLCLAGTCQYQLRLRLSATEFLFSSSRQSLSSPVTFHSVFKTLLVYSTRTRTRNNMKSTVAHVFELYSNSYMRLSGYGCDKATIPSGWR